MNESDNQNSGRIESSSEASYKNFSPTETQLEAVKLINESLRLESEVKDSEILRLKKENYLLRKENNLLRKNFKKLRTSLLNILKKTNIAPDLYKMLSEQKGLVSDENALSSAEDLILPSDNMDFSAPDKKIPAFQPTTPVSEMIPSVPDMNNPVSNINGPVSNVNVSVPYLTASNPNLNTLPSNITPAALRMTNAAPGMTADGSYINPVDLEVTPVNSGVTGDGSYKTFLPPDRNSMNSHFTAGATGINTSGFKKTSSPSKEALSEKDEKAAQSPSLASDKQISLESIAQAVILKAGKHSTRMVNGVKKIIPNKNEIHTAELIMKGIENCCNITDDPEKSRLASYRMIMTLRHEINSRNSAVKTFITITRILLYLYRNGKFTVDDLTAKLGYSRGYSYEILKVFIKKGWIAEFIPWRSDAFYISEEGRRFVESVIF